MHSMPPSHCPSDCFKFKQVQLSVCCFWHFHSIGKVGKPLQLNENAITGNAGKHYNLKLQIELIDFEYVTQGSLSLDIHSTQASLKLI